MVGAAELDELLTKAERLKALLAGSPEIISYMQLIKDTAGLQAPLPRTADRLLYPSEVRDVLRISDSTLDAYRKQGILQAVHTPPNGRRKYWLSDVLAVPKPE